MQNGGSRDIGMRWYGRVLAAVRNQWLYQRTGRCAVCVLCCCVHAACCMLYDVCCVMCASCRVASCGVVAIVVVMRS